MNDDEVAYMLKLLERGILKLDAKASLVEVIAERLRRMGDEMTALRDRVEELESDRTWLGRLIVGIVLTAVMTGAFALERSS